MTRLEAAQAAVLQVVCTHGRDSVIALSLEQEVNWLLTWHTLFETGFDSPNTHTKQAFITILKENNIE